MSTTLRINEGLRPHIDAAKKAIVMQRLSGTFGWLGNLEAVVGYLTPADYAEIDRTVAKMRGALQGERGGM